MKENKRIIFISSIVCVITLSLSIFLNFTIKTEVAIYVSNILLNVFAGAIMLIATSLVYYFVERRKVLTELMDEILKVRNLFSNLEYLIDMKTYSFDEYKEFNKDNKAISILTEEEKKKIYEKDKNSFKAKQYEKMEEEMKKYLIINKYDLTYFWSLYDRIDFLFSRKKKEEIYNLVFKYTQDLRNEICEKCYHFKQYFNAKRGNKVVNYSFVREIQEKIFYFENKTYEDKTSWGIDLKQVNYCCYFNNINGVSFITSNNVIEYYSNAFDEIGKIAYFDKKYNTKK